MKGIALSLHFGWCFFTQPAWRALMVLVLCTGALAPLGAKEPDYAALETVFLDDALAQCDIDSHAKKLVAVIEKAPGSHEALAALRQLRDEEPNLADNTRVLTLLRQLEADNFRACGVYARIYADTFVRVCGRVDAAKAAAVHTRWRGITEFSVIGPFAEYGPSAHDDTFSPEVCCEFAGTMQGVFGPVKWKKLPHFDQNDDRLDLGLHDRHMGACYYAATLLNCDSATDVLLEFELSCPGRVWLRGAPLIDIDTRRREYPKLVFESHLAKGENLLLLKLSGNSPFRVGVRDAGGQPVAGLVTTAPAKGHYAITSGKPLCEMPRILQESYYRNALSKLGADEKRKRGLCLLALSQSYRVHELDTLSTEAMEDALAELADIPFAQILFIQHIGQSGLYSGSEVNRLRRQTLSRLLKLEKPPASAFLEQALIYARDERVQEAVDLFRRAQLASPPSWNLCIDEAQFYQQLQWRHEWLGALERARKIAPRAPALHKAFARFYEAHEMPGAALVENARLAELRPEDPDLTLTLISQFARAARPEKSLELARTLVKRREGDAYALKRLAEVLNAQGKVDEAVALYERLAAMTPRQEEHLRPAAEALLAVGRVDTGKAMLQRLLKLAPAAHEVRSWLARLGGTREEFWAPWALPLSEVLKHDVKPAVYPQCASVMLLDEQVEVAFEDGSAQLFVRQIRRILTQDGVDAFGKARPSGEICAARTIQPDGTILEPVTFRGNEVEYPGVKVGSLLELAYIQREDSTPFGSVRPSRFYFADQTLSEPFVISRFVLLAPKALPLQVRYYNWPKSGPGLIQTDKVENETRILTWDLREARYLRRESFMPSALEFIPWLDIVWPRDWRLRARELADETLPMLRTSRLIDEKAQELCRGCKTAEQKARAIYTWVNATLATEGDSRTAHQALKAGAGDRKKTFAALCFAAGVELAFCYADLAPVYRGGKVEALPVPDWAMPEDTDFKTLMFIVHGDHGAPVYVNLDARLRPFGEVSARLDFAPAIVWRAGRCELSEIRGGVKTRDRFNNLTRITLSADGSATASGVIETIGERSYELKELVRKQSEQDRTRELEEQVADQLRGFEAEQCAFPDLETVGKPLTRAFGGNVPKLARLSGSQLKLALPLEKFAPLLSPLIASDAREHDLVLDFDLNQTDELRIEAPKGWHFTNLPQDLMLPCAPLSYALSFRIENNELIVTRRMSLGPGRVPSHAYADFVRQIRRLGSGEEAELTLERDGVKAATPQDIAPRGK